MDQQDTFNNAVSTFIERKVRSWLSGVLEEMRRNGPVQQWLDSLPVESARAESNQTPTDNLNEDNLHPDSKHTASLKEDETSSSSMLLVQDNKSLNSSDWKRKSFDNGALTSTPQKSCSRKLTRDHSIQSEGCVYKIKNPLLRDYSLQSDGSGSSGSSVLNLLGARKVDAEAVLLELGFGPSEKQQKLQRIPDRFLVPSKLKGISTEKFIKDEQHSMRMHDCGVFGYRGLTGNPHVPPSTIVAKIMERIVRDDGYRRELSNARLSVSPPTHCPTRFLRNT